MDITAAYLIVLFTTFSHVAGYWWSEPIIPPPRNNRPNIVLIVADDLGWNDVGWRNSIVKTPNLDRLSKHGVLLENSYAQQTCTPSRGAMLTGKYPYRLGIQHAAIFPNQPKFLPKKEILLPQILKKAGYRTHLIGKWHLGQCSYDVIPTSRGFDTFYGLLQGVENFFTRRVLGVYDFWENDRITFPPNGTYNTDLFTERAIRIIEDPMTRTSPFFIKLAHTTPHFPLQVPEPFKDLYPGVMDEDRKTYLGMVSSLDYSVGKVVKSLERTGHMENTIIIFISDNGGDYNFGASNFPLNGNKINLYEGGSKTNNLVYSPKYLQYPGCKYRGLTHVVDWFSTILDMAGCNKETPPGLDSRSQWPYIQQCRGSARNEFVYNIDEISNTAAIRVDEYKLIQGDPRVFIGSAPNFTLADPTSNRVRLFNLKDDPYEQHDIASTRLDIVIRMLSKLNYYRKFTVPDPHQPQLPRNITAPNNILRLGWC